LIWKSETKEHIVSKTQHKCLHFCKEWKCEKCN